MEIYQSIPIEDCSRRTHISVYFDTVGIDIIKAYCQKEDRKFVALNVKIVGAGIDLAKDICTPQLKVVCKETECPHNAKYKHA